MSRTTKMKEALESFIKDSLHKFRLENPSSNPYCLHLIFDFSEFMNPILLIATEEALEERKEEFRSKISKEFWYLPKKFKVKKINKELMTKNMRWNLSGADGCETYRNVSGDILNSLFDRYDVFVNESIDIDKSIAFGPDLFETNSFMGRTYGEPTETHSQNVKIALSVFCSTLRTLDLEGQLNELGSRENYILLVSYQEGLGVRDGLSGQRIKTKDSATSEILNSPSEKLSKYLEATA